jgi:hypothetical protein
MLKWNQFESKNKNKKDPKPLIKKRVKSKNDIEQKRQEIRDKMNVYVNGASSYSEGFAFSGGSNNILKNGGFDAEIKITPEWILSKFSWSQNAGDGNIFLSADIYNSHWVELALDTLGISYIKVEDIDYNGKAYIRFKLILEGFKDEYPSWYQEMYNLNPGKYTEVNNN